MFAYRYVFIGFIQLFIVHSSLESNNIRTSDSQQANSSVNPLINSMSMNQFSNRAFTGTIDINTTSPLVVDQALVDLIVDRKIIGDLTVYIQVTQCINCLDKRIPYSLSSEKSLRLVLSTDYTYRVRIVSSNQSSCSQTIKVGEHGEYLLNVQPSTTADSNSNSFFQCTWTVRRAPNKVYIPIIVGFTVVFVLFVLCLLANRFKLMKIFDDARSSFSRRLTQQNSSLSYDLQHQTNIESVPTTTMPTVDGETITKLTETKSTGKSKRLLTLDAFRGLTLIAMIFVNYGSGGYAEFEHAPWHGITFADIVFPFFVWMLGTSMVMSLKNASNRKASKASLLWKTLTRTLKLFIIGFILGARSRVFLANARVLGVLQRFAIVYGVVATIEVIFLRPGQYISASQHYPEYQGKATCLQRFRILFYDIVNFPFQWLINILLAVLWILVVYLVPFENCPAGYLGPGGLHEYGKYANCTGGITGYIDRKIITSAHLFQNPTCVQVYECKNFDPENLFGAIPSMFLAYLGIQAGRILVIYQKHSERLIRLFLWSIVNIVLALILTKGTLDGGPMPLNKNIWTLSFSFFTAGLAFGGFAFMYILIDMLHWWDATPFQYPGMNSILIYICHSVFSGYFPVQWGVENTHAARLAMALWGCIFWIIVSYILYRKKIFLVL